MKTYRGHRWGGGCAVTVGGRVLDPRHDLFNHSPTGFEWGYGGSGPAQLALAILADYTGDGELAVRMHQAFKRELVETIDGDEWRLTADEVAGWLMKKGYIVGVDYGEE